MLTDLAKRFMVGAYLTSETEMGDKRFQLFKTPENLLRQMDKAEYADCIKFYLENQADADYYLQALEYEEELDEKILNDASESIVRFRTGTATKEDASYISKLHNVNIWNEKSKPVSWRDYVGEGYKRYECRKVLHECFESGGFKSKSLYIIGGYTGSGKSLLCMNLLMYLKTDCRAVYFNMENSKDETYERLQEFTNSSIAPYCHDFDIIDGIRTIDDVITDIRKYKYDFVVIDQLSMLDINVDAENIRIVYKNVCQKLAEVARELDICIILSCQLNRAYMANFKDKDDSEWRQSFSELDDTVFAESSDITRPAQSVVITTIHKCSDFDYTTGWITNVKQRSGNAKKCLYYQMKGVRYENPRDY